MIVKGKKFVEMTNREKDILTGAVRILEDLVDAIGDEQLDDYYDITNTAEQLASIRDVSEFVVELSEDY